MEPQIPKPTEPTKDISWGVIDNYKTFDNSDEISFQNIFVAWNEDTTELESELSKVEKLGREAIVTIEPWPYAETNFHLNDILEGDYDQTIINTCEVFDDQENTVLFRFAHEMDLFPSSRYPWATNDFKTFQLMFKRVVDICREQTDNIKIVWSPGGTNGMMNFYPGDEYVDIIGFSVYSFQEFELETTDRTFSFVDLFNYKYDLVKDLKKDIMIAEMGVSGSDEYSKQWLEDALIRIKSPQLQRYLKYVVYLNAKDDFRWVETVEPPDFRIKENQFPNIK